MSGESAKATTVAVVVLCMRVKPVEGTGVMGVAVATAAAVKIVLVMAVILAEDAGKVDMVTVTEMAAMAELVAAVAAVARAVVMVVDHAQSRTVQSGGTVWATSRGALAL